MSINRGSTLTIVGFLCQRIDEEPSSCSKDLIQFIPTKDTLLDIVFVNGRRENAVRKPVLPQVLVLQTEGWFALPQP